MRRVVRSLSVAGGKTATRDVDVSHVATMLAMPTWISNVAL